ncbi:MAG: hypothetical protein EPN85_11595 [Bacteroidetes bacterium]|nr:MAG: hypothetical protein EPN85_11595 [Bacteroidota bacterium]
MKAFLPLFVICCLSTTTFSQDSTNLSKKVKIIFGLNVSHVLSEFGGNDYALSLSIMAKAKFRHYLFVGPFFVGRNSIDSRDFHIDTHGFQAAYKFCHNKKHKRVDLYFEHTLQYLKYNYNYYGYHYDGYYLHNYLGYGLNINVISGLYANCSVGLGTAMHNSYIGSTYYGRDNYGAIIIKTGIGYNF